MKTGDKILDRIVKIHDFFKLSKKRKYWILNQVKKLLKLEGESVYFPNAEVTVEKVQSSFALSLTEYKHHEENRTLYKRVLEEYAKAMLKAKLLKVHIAVDTRLGQYHIRATGAVVAPKAVLEDAPTLLEKMQNEN